jgi:hypothetical protein
MKLKILQAYVPCYKLECAKLINTFLLNICISGNHNTTMYTSYEMFHNHICLVCGSFQCPYCPHYNLAPSLGPSIMATWAMGVVVYFAVNCNMTNSLTYWLLALLTFRRPIHSSTHGS